MIHNFKREDTDYSLLESRLTFSNLKMTGSLDAEFMGSLENLDSEPDYYQSEPPELTMQF